MGTFQANARINGKNSCLQNAVLPMASATAEMMECSGGFACVAVVQSADVRD
jgi:hypothetical protein